MHDLAVVSNSATLVATIHHAGEHGTSRVGSVANKQGNHFVMPVDLRHMEWRQSVVWVGVQHSVGLSYIVGDTVPPDGYIISYGKVGVKGFAIPK